MVKIKKRIVNAKCILFDGKNKEEIIKLCPQAIYSYAYYLDKPFTKVWGFVIPKYGHSQFLREGFWLCFENDVTPDFQVISDTDFKKRYPC